MITLQNPQPTTQKSSVAWPAFDPFFVFINIQPQVKGEKIKNIKIKKKPTKLHGAIQLEEQASKQTGIKKNNMKLTPDITKYDITFGNKWNWQNTKKMYSILSRIPQLFLIFKRPMIVSKMKDMFTLRLIRLLISKIQKPVMFIQIALRVQGVTQRSAVYYKWI
ncbi:Hypothetical protein CINCED_3A023595 [Cinara cedri]|uniref:Uncharacterized protein n=1 Tax=Cinara cedri TaxID=506608 RepID=A0A5E4ME93_9HEMI|nr:Hypothetical protein CINCED_3A023595 [Cinara cedri]